ncbi:hypothetical protein BBO99_00003346 [Phytophthora kernoviae]|uniref:STAS domain-containing protein n=2 Tax=Phytophthora kernoviae TaxID=325452 RepID=A0A421GU81_9STRA|nr:hypothetical protein G195_003661 [Phytophthora kernoviae 00238/432]KAG2529870.1 hypothetical protein JM18_002660 [Phytophthora kernoviae]RLN21469.1 hypothetical protein BBI17_003404 [Phytophthora kernoviae]RLN81867.1 hypothetical protein BBO99_00003346 [Phytophthora kernoviae]
MASVVQGNRLSQLSQFSVVSITQRKTDIGSPSRALLVSPNENAASLKRKDDNTGKAAHLTNAFMYGIINSILTIPTMYGYAVILFSHPNFADFMPALSKLVMFSSVIHQLMFTLLSSLPFSIGQVQDAGLIFLSTMATSICDSLGEDELVGAKVTTTIVTLGIATALLGVCLVVMGQFKLAALASYLPMPVIGGYLAFIGIFCLYAGLALCTGLVVNNISSMLDVFGKAHDVLLCVPGVLGGAFLLFISQRYESSFILSGAIMIMPVVFFLILVVGGISMEEARDDGWIDPAKDPATVSELINLFDFSLVHWDQVPKQFGTWIGMVFIVAFSSCLDIAAIELDMGAKLDFNHELKTVGWSNVVSGLLGGYTGSYIFSQTIFTYRSKTNSRIVGMCVIVSEFAIVVAPISVMSYVPRFFFAATLIFIAIDLMIEWLVLTYKKMSLREYAVLWMTFVAVNLVSLDLGMLIGVGIAVLNFLLGYIRLPVVSQQPHCSAAVRTPMERKLLDQKRDAIAYFELHGYLFFGSSVQILDSVQKSVFVRKVQNGSGQMPGEKDECDTGYLGDTDMPLTPMENRESAIECLDGSPAPHPKGLPTEFVVMDFSSVTAMDVTAARSAFLILQKYCDNHGISVVYAGMLPKICKLLLKNKIAVEESFFSTTELALEFCENELLSRANSTVDVQRASEHQNEHISLLLHQFMGEPEDSQLLHGVDQFFQRHQVSAGHEFYHMGQSSDHFYFLSPTSTLDRDCNGTEHDFRDVSGDIVHVEHRCSREAQYRDLEPLQLSPQVCAALEKCYGIKLLYSHQFNAVEAIRRGENAVLSTATASGKSLAYNVPMLDMLLKDPDARFMYLFPTKALAQDQLKSLRNFLAAADLPLHLGATFDGDTAMKSRSMVIRETRIFLTNPDMLHLTILPNHTQWKNVLSNLRLLVVDEAHMYRGVFGSHVSCVFRRLFRLSRDDTRNLIRRVSSYRGGYTLDARRQIEQRLFSGDLLGVVATNALELGIDIGELDCTIHLGLPSSIASLWQQAGRAGRRQQQTIQKKSVAIIVCFDSPLDQHFAQKHHATELFQLEPEAVSLNPMNSHVLGQHLLCAARESALYSSRSGADYIDSFVFGSLDSGSDRDNIQNDYQAEISEVNQVLQPLVKEKKLMKNAETGGHACYRIHSCMPKKIRAVSLRNICDENYTVVVPSNNVNDEITDGEVLDEIPGDKAFFQVYPTAVYLHQAQEYIITRLDNIQRIAFAKKCPKPLKYFTSCRDFTDLEAVRIQSTARFGSVGKQEEDTPVLLRVGIVSIQTRVIGSTILEKRTMRFLGTNEFSLPLMQSFGEAVWLEFPLVLREEVEASGEVSWTAALHGVGHLFVALVRLFVLCDAADIGTEHLNEFEQRARPNRVTIFERREGGSGLVPEIVKVLPKDDANSNDRNSQQLAKITNALMYGVINSVLTIPCMYGYAAIIFGHPDFANFMPALSKLVMFSSVIHQVMFTLLSSLPFAIGQVQDAGLIFLSAIATSICNSLGEEVPLEAKVTTTVVTIGLATASLGVCLVLLGKFKLAGLVSYLPMPVVGGYLAFIGLFCFYAGLSLCTGLVINDFTSMMQIWDPHYMVLCVPGILGGVVLLLVSQRCENSFALPAAILLMPMAFFVVLALCGVSLDEARDYGWVAPSSDPAGFVQMFDLFDFSQMHWNQVPRQFTTWLGMTFVVAFSSCLDVAAIEMDMGSQLNINHELKSVGWSNFVSGLLGGYTGSYIFSQTIFTYRSKTNSRIVGVCVIISEFAIVLVPLSVMSLVPRFFFAATLIFIAIDLMVEWLVHVYHKILPREYVVLWLSFIAINLVSLELGMVLGVGFAIINFLLGYAQVRVVNRRSRSSAAVRKLAARTMLGQKRGAIVYLELYGYLFFGSSVQILEDVQKAVHIRKLRAVKQQSSNGKDWSQYADDAGIPLTPVSKRDVPITCLDGSPAPHPDGLPTEYVVMDFSRVSGMDATAARSAFMILQQHCKQHEITVFFADVLPEIRSLLLNNEIAEGENFFLNADSALEFCENQLLINVNNLQDINLHHESMSVLLHRFMGEPDDSVFFCGVDQFFRKYEVPEGYEFYRVASYPDRFYFLASGRVALFMNDDGSVAPGKTLTLLENVMPGAMFGEVDFFGRQYRYMAATAMEPCTVFEMNRATYESMDELAPTLWNRLRDVVMQSMALSITNTTSINSLNNTSSSYLPGNN